MSWHTKPEPHELRSILRVVIKDSSLGDRKSVWLTTTALLNVPDHLLPFYNRQGICVGEDLSLGEAEDYVKEYNSQLGLKPYDPPFITEYI